MLFVFGLLAACTPEKTEAELSREKEIEEATKNMIEAQKELERLDSLEEELHNRY